MAAIQITGDLKYFNKDQLDTVYKVLEELNFADKEVSIEPLGKAGDNFASDVRVVKVKVDDNEELRIILKLKSNVTVSAMSEISVIFFNNEVIMYTELLPLMTQLQKNEGIPDKDLFKYAKCYGGSREPGQEIILLEDLTKYNYSMLDKFTPLSNECIKVILTKLADYHSLSYVLKDREPKKFAEFSKRLIDMNVVMGSKENIQGYKILGDSFSAVFDKEKYKKVVINAFNDEAMTRIRKLREADTGSKYSVIIHGDTWTNNILFKLEDDKPTDCILIDYQIVKEAPPVVDILYLLFNCTDYETRSKYYYEWLDHYHSELGKALFNFGLRVNNVYPRDRLDSDIMRYSRFSLGFAFITSSLLLRKTEEAATIKEAMAETQDMSDLVNQIKISEGSLGMESVLKIRQRVEGLIDSCYDFGFLNGA